MYIIITYLSRVPLPLAFLAIIGYTELNRYKNMTESNDIYPDAEVSPGESSTLAKVSFFFLEVIKIAILAGVTIFLVRYFLFKPFYVRGQSMEPNFYEKEYLIVDELTYRFRQPERGEVVVFQSPTEPGEYYLKRVIGLPGERVRVEDNKVILYNEAHPQGTLVDETYLNQVTLGNITVTLGADQYFVLGDNRAESYDSRRFGPVDTQAIVGRAIFRGWPLLRIGTFDTPTYDNL